jgi:hypothetical protein
MMMIQNPPFVPRVNVPTKIDRSIFIVLIYSTRSFTNGLFEIWGRKGFPKNFPNSKPEFDETADSGLFPRKILIVFGGNKVQPWSRHLYIISIYFSTYLYHLISSSNSKAVSQDTMPKTNTAEAR